MSNLLRVETQSVIPIGTIIEAVGPPDSSWLKCDGSILTKTSYPGYVTVAGDLHPQMWKTWDFVDVDQAVNETYKSKISFMGSNVVIVGSDATVWYSSDSGATWSTTDSLPTGTKNLLINNGTYFVTAISGGSNVYYSTDSTSWTTVPVGVSDSWLHSIYALGKFIIMPDGYSTSSDYYLYSSNGTTWNTASIPFSSGYIKGITADANYFYFYAYYSDSFYKIYRSSDGTTWSAGTKDIHFGLDGMYSYTVKGMSILNGKMVLSFDYNPLLYVCEGTDPRDPDDYAVASFQPACSTGQIMYGQLHYVDDHYVLFNESYDFHCVGKSLYNLTGFRSPLQYIRASAFKADGSVGLAIPSGYSTLTYRSVARSTGVPYDSSTQFQLPYETMNHEGGMYKYIKVAE